MSEQRSSSAVRNLRSLFENKNTLDSNSPDTRGRSPSGVSSDKEDRSRRTSKVRASFVSVEPSKNMAATSDSMAQRRGSFTETDSNVLELKKTISEHQENLEVPEKALLDSAVASAAGSTATTPSRKPNESPKFDEIDDSPLAGKHEKEPMNPDKPVTGAEEEPAAMKPADLADADAVSGGEALPPAAEDLRPTAEPTASATVKKDSKKPMTNGKPASIATKAANKPGPSSLKSPASQPSSANTISPNASNNVAPAKKASRSSLAAPTAASMARNGPASDRPSNPKTSPNSKPKAREVTKPVSLPSHLTAPTASSRAKHEPEPVGLTSSNSLRTSTSTKPKLQTSSTKPRTSLAAHQRRESHSSQTSARRSMPAVDVSFLDRMMKPTAASASHVREKAEPKSPIRSKAAPAKPKVNGTASKAASKPISHGASAHERADGHHDASGHTSGHEIAADADQTTAGAESTGSETPNARINGEAQTTLEATPATLGGART